MPPKPETPKPKKPRKPRKKTTAISKNFASKVGNGTSMFLDASGAIDQRSLPARRFRELTINVTSDIAGGGGLDSLSEVQKQLCKRFAGAAVVAELMEAAIVRGAADADIGQYCTVINALNRLGGTIGIRRAAIDVTPSLADLLAKQVAERTQKDAEDEDEDEGGK